jgi:hypothetical protein
MLPTTFFGFVSFGKIYAKNRFYPLKTEILPNPGRHVFVAEVVIPIKFLIARFLSTFNLIIER